LPAIVLLLLGPTLSQAKEKHISCS